MKALKKSEKGRSCKNKIVWSFFFFSFFQNDLNTLRCYTLHIPMAKQDFWEEGGEGEEAQQILYV